MSIKNFGKKTIGWLRDWRPVRDTDYEVEVDEEGLISEPKEQTNQQDSPSEATETLHSHHTSIGQADLDKLIEHTKMAIPADRTHRFPHQIEFLDNHRSTATNADHIGVRNQFELQSNPGHRPIAGPRCSGRWIFPSQPYGNDRSG